MTDREVMQQALEALESLQGGCTDHDDGTVEAITVWCPEVIDALRTALEQQAEPVALKCVAIIEVFDKDWRMEYLSLPVGKHKLYTQQYIYTTPPQRQWVGLTDEEIKAAWSQLWCDINKMKLAPDDRPQKETVGFIFAKAIEAKLKERNHDR